MTPEMYVEISDLSRTPSPATDRTEVLTGKSEIRAQTLDEEGM